MQYLKLYKYPGQVKHAIRPTEINSFKLIFFKPSLLKVSYKGTNWIKSLLWFLLTGGRYEILYLLDSEKVVHYSYIMSKNVRFPFMNESDYQVGPCFTHEEYRGKGIYTNVLKLIPALYKLENNEIWIYTMNNNIASQKAIEKAGYTFYSFLIRKGLLMKLSLVPVKMDQDQE